MVGLKVDFLWYPIGNDEFVHSFFSTICFNLEKMKWGDRFPHIMNELYQGELNFKDADAALKEVILIREEFKAFSPKKVVWDIDNLRKKPPWKNKISKEITNLSNYFVTCEGNDLFGEIIKALGDSKTEQQNVMLESI